MLNIIIAAQYRIHPNVWGGMDEFILALHRQLTERGVSMQVVVPMYPGTDASHYFEKSIPCVVLEGPLFLDSLHEFCLKNPSKILHTHFLPILTAKYRKFMGLTGVVITTEHMPRPLIGWTLIKKIRTKASALVGKKYITMMIHVSQYLEKENISFFGKSVGKKSTIIYNGVGIKDLDRKYPKKISSISKLKLVSAGRLVPEKGFSDLIKMIRMIIERCGNIVELDILGDGPTRTELEIESGDLLNSSINFRGFVKDVRERFRNADIYVHTSSQEAFAFVLLEAGEAGLPAIAYDVGGNSEFISNGKNGMLIEAGNICEMADQIIKLSNNPSEIERQGKNSRLLIESKFSMDRMVADYTRIYDKYL